MFLENFEMSLLEKYMMTLKGRKGRRRISIEFLNSSLFKPIKGFISALFYLKYATSM
jgi:hypothetical protein